MTDEDVEALLDRLATAEGERDRARGVAVALEQECAELREALAAIATYRHTGDIPDGTPAEDSQCPACGPAVYALSVLDRTDPHRDIQEEPDATTS